MECPLLREEQSLVVKDSGLRMYDFAAQKETCEISCRARWHEGQMGILARP